MWSCHYSYRAQRLHPACLMFLTGPDWSRLVQTCRHWSVCVFADDEGEVRWVTTVTTRPPARPGDPAGPPATPQRPGAPAGTSTAPACSRPSGPAVVWAQSTLGQPTVRPTPPPFPYSQSAPMGTPMGSTLTTTTTTTKGNLQPTAFTRTKTHMVHISKWTPTYHHGGYLDAKGAKIKYTINIPQTF